MGANYRPWDFPRGSGSKESACNAGDPGSVPGWGKCPAGEIGYPLQCSCLENRMDRGAWRATVRGVARVRHDWSDLACIKGETRRHGFDPQVRQIPGEGNVNTLQYSCLRSPKDPGAWWATVQRVARVGHDWATKPPAPFVTQDTQMQRHRQPLLLHRSLTSLPRAFTPANWPGSGA